MDDMNKTTPHKSAREKFLALSLESSRKSYYPQLKKHLEKTKENEKRLQLLIDNLPALISYVNSEERYVLVNRAFVESFDLKHDHIIGKRMETILGKKIYNKVNSYIGKALSGKSGHFELSIATKKKGTKWYEINYVSETNPQGIVNGFYSLIIDSTEKKQAEEEKTKLKDRLRQAQKMEAIGTLSGGIAHDFNNILSGIFGYSQLADIHINDPERAREYISKIVGGAQRASSLIQQILAFSRQTKYSKQPLSFFILTKEVLRLIRSTIPSNIAIKEVLNTRAMILADSTQIHQVIMNLCTNAYHAMGDDGGLLTVGLDEVLLTTNQMPRELNLVPGKYLKLEVCDTGPGIDHQIKEKIFDPYFTTKSIGKGTGLGLAVVDGIVKKHNGFIKLKTKLGVGTTFQIYLPAIEDELACADVSKKEEEELSTKTEKIMLVDDEPAILETLKAILSRQGYEVSTFNNGESALQVFADNSTEFDLIITDMTMPQMTGDKLSREVLKIREEIPIIICTGYHENFSEEEAIRAGIKKYLQKPVIGKELPKIIRDLLNTKQH